MINRVVLVGRLTRDPAELRRSANNVAVINIYDNTFFTFLFRASL